jgi:hypothetical protein
MRVVLNKKFKDDDEDGGNTSSFVKEEQKILDELQEEIKESHVGKDAIRGGQQGRNNH